MAYEKPKIRPSPSQVMYNRMREMQKRAEDAAAKKVVEEQERIRKEAVLAKQTKRAAMTYTKTATIASLRKTPVSSIYAIAIFTENVMWGNKILHG